ncbi:MAG: alpha-glucuronidase family glycosyl hydrolase [Terracidiphilus sp.]|nr:alpha-glucuronidase family glycosyl hydrolase [Terracidiphilus sp.]MDR3775425.1 alpha-glucuronidase family glycosyl hydrolase [Terracidiphilus sp.]
MMRSRIDFIKICVITAALAGGVAAAAQTADQAWLRDSHDHGRTTIPLKVEALGHGTLEQSAAKELQRGITGLTGISSYVEASAIDGKIVVGTVQQVHKAYPELAIPADLAPEGYWLNWSELHDGHALRVVAGADERGALYGAFALLRLLATDQDLTHLNLRSNPAFPIRWVDEWDNPDGSIERGYAGRSIFFEGGNVRKDLAPVAEYARLLASVGINGCNVNNVNAAVQLIDSEHLKQLARVADAMRPWGVRMALSVDIASPQKIGGLATFDPLDPAVKAWWAAKVEEIYELVPDFAGLTVKADSEGQPGPASYGRTPADAANLLAAALQPHGGIVLYRAFVYNHHADWRDPKADRARAAYDIFHPLDGKFAANVVLQIKEGPIDFQAREPVSPLFAGLRQSGSVMELQVTQEYTGQQRHLVYLAPMWKQVLDFDLRADGKSTPVKEILAGKAFHQPLGGMVGVSGVGRDAWLGSPLALANLYAFGRLAWDPDLTSDQIAAEWTEQTLGNDPQVVATVQKMLMQSWPAYENYTGPLGMQTLTDITGSHYGSGIESSENNGWGQWHRADKNGVGMDRSVTTGTGYAGQYPPEVAKLYEDAATTPDELQLFFHHVPYTYRLHSGKTVIQHIYDSHYDGAAQAAKLVDEWNALEGHIDQPLYEQMRDRLKYQAGHAIVWRDAIVQYFFRLSGIPDVQGRAGHYPGRMEAEDARLTGYKVIDVTPWEDASGGKAVSCDQTNCSAEWTYSGKPGRYNIAVQYFDLQGGKAHFAFKIDGQRGAAWAADAVLPSTRPNGDNSTRYTVHAVDLKTGDVLRVEGVPDGTDPAALDYIEIAPVAEGVSSKRAN